MDISRLIPILVISLTLAYGSPVRATIFDFTLAEIEATAQLGEKRCQELGYDGLAIVASPEAYAYALRILAPLARSNITYGAAYVGLSYNQTREKMTWADGSLPVPDIPAKDSSVWEPSAGKLHARINYNGLLWVTGGEEKRDALCGQHRQQSYECYGSSTHGQELTVVGSSLSESTCQSYPECVLLCSQDHWCRAAMFNSDLLTCKILGPNSFSGFTNNTAVTSFVRNGFK